MANIVIKKTRRLGNLIKQLINALHIALYYNFNVSFPKHKFFNTTYIVINKTVTLKNKQIFNDFDFYERDKIKNVFNHIFDINKEKVISIIKNMFIIKSNKTLGNNDLLIHIRSGDIFSNPNPNRKYLTPPLSYYTDIIAKNNFTNIYLIAEDTLNPCINKLLELYPKINFKLQSLEQDIQIVLSAVNVVISFGTFIPQLLHLSENVKQVYCPSYSVYNNPKCNIHVTQLQQYYKSMIPWRNTVEQKNKMLEL
jgi:hypothetical protein